ncbi:pirin family protein [Gordonia sp. KTR9]|uniref:pirin family protein n=1 Tax=Gordonia sp. KTR9 TaxID=337191 RepID=UPI00027DDFF3|nr:pirin family protein [Gordonia sp. KTR9]AFR49530.1 Pirin-related protein [Gordonia sp. KTR9]
MSETRATTTTSPQVIRGADRYVFRSEWLDSRQSFPVTGNFDLTANAHGVLLVHNDDRVDAGEGFEAHFHRDAEIVAWVLEGAVAHRDSFGNAGVITPGVAQRMSAGRGITHTEANASRRGEDRDLRVVQMWVAPEHAGGEPGYAERDFSADLATGALVTVASGMAGHATTTAISLKNPDAALHVARLGPGQSVTLPPAPFGHLYVARGVVDLDDGARLVEGDALRTTDHGALIVSTTTEAEILFWEMHTTFSR